MATLHAELRRALSGEPRLVAVQGGAGIGKSALLARFVEDAHLPLVLRASGAEEETGLAWGVLDQMARGASAVLGRRGAWPKPAPDSDPLRVGAGLVEALGLLQQAGPVAVVLDDAHWADPPSSQSLLFALRRLEVDRVLVARRLAEHTGGSPLYARALLEELEPAALQRSGGPLPAPRSYSALVLSRLSACGPATEALVAAAAVLGARAPLSLVAQVAGVPDLEAALSEAIRARLLVDEHVPGGPEVSFPHPLVRAAIYTDLGPSRRGELHRRAALALGSREALVHRLAVTFGPDRDLAAVLEQLGREEALRGDGRGAGLHLLQAAQVSPAGPDRHHRILAGVGAYFLAGETGAAEEARSELVRLPPSAERSYFLGHIALWQARAGEAEEELRRAWGLLGDPDDAPALGVGITSQLAVISALAFRFEEARHWAELAVELSRAAPALEGAALLSWAAATAIGGGANEVASRLDALGPAGEMPPRLLDALTARGIVQLWTDDVDGAVADLEVVLERARSGQTVRMLALSAAFLREAYYRRGALGEAVVRAELACTLAEEAGRDWDLSIVHALAAYPRAARGDLSEAAAHAEAATASAEAFGLAGPRAFAACARALVARASGDLQTLARAAEAFRLPREPGVFPVGPLRAEALVQAGEPDRAEWLLTTYETEAASLKRSSSLAAAACVRVALEAARGRMEAAGAAYREGRAAAARARQPLAEARLRLAYSRALARGAEQARARLELTEAAAAFEALGALPDLEQAQLELARTGGRFRANSPPLTAKESAVAQLVAEGLSNREAAARLIVSVKTVEYHLGHVYDKLGVRSRSQLVATLRG